MKHATPATLRKLGPLLARLRKLPLDERKAGIFYRRGQAFLHFHESIEDDLLAADVRFPKGWVRVWFTAGRTAEVLHAVQAALRRLPGRAASSRAGARGH